MPRDGEHGPLPPLLLLLTVVTGLVDAFSYLRLGRVFVANMTGNVVFLGFALAGVSGFVWWASILAIAAFSVGALLGGRIANRHGSHRGRHLLSAVIAQTGFVAVAFVVAQIRHAPYDSGATAVMIALLSMGMGVQNATARALKVPDLTTTVLTQTLTGISADSTVAGGSGSRLRRRLISVVSMFFGAFAGALLVEAGKGSWVLLIVVLLLAVIAAAAAYTSKSTDAWTARR